MAGETDPLLGTTAAGRYRVERRLGWAAWASSTSRDKSFSGARGR